MHDMTRRRRLAALCAVAGVALGTASCSSEGANRDKAGGPGEPVVLTMATVNGDLKFIPQARYFVDRVKELSDGNLRIEVEYEVGGGSDEDAEQQVVRGVADDTYDLGVVGTQVFDTMGVTSFQALNAPMLIDSYALQAAVLESGVTDAMMEPLSDIGVTGVATLAGTLRKPVSVEKALVAPADWQGVTFGTYLSEAEFEAVRALGARPKVAFGGARDQALRAGSIGGFEAGLLLYRLNNLYQLAPYVTTNVTLWPQMLTVFANPDVDGRLTTAQRDWLGQAAEDAQTRSVELADADARSLEEVCTLGARPVQASDAELVALQQAFAPVYTDLARDPETKQVLDQIEALKSSTPAQPALNASSECAESSPSDGDAASGTTPSYLNGVYRYTLTHEDAVAAGQGDDPEYPMTQTWWLENGSWHGSGGSAGQYWVDGDQISLAWTQPFEAVFTFSFTRDDDGNLTLVPAEPMDPSDAFLMSGKPWTKIG
jgi:TRAP-type C4-dicarboxylate transport system substrate-binding protein